MHALYLPPWNDDGNRILCPQFHFAKNSTTVSPRSQILVLRIYRYIGFRLITEKDINSQLMSSWVDSPPLDILVRTSGVKRLSDFMLWQVRFWMVSIRFYTITVLPFFHSVLWGYPTSILFCALAQLWSLRLYTNHFRLSAQDMG